MLAYLSCYTHRVAISNSRLIKADATGVTFRVKNYRVEGRARYTTMTLDVDEFIRRALIHVLPKGFHRVRHYGLFASGGKADDLTAARDLLTAPAGAPLKLNPYQNKMNPLLYALTTGSCVISRSGSWRAWAIMMRSNGSRCKAGKVATAAAWSAVTGKSS